jgi:hypothetical protein
MYLFVRDNDSASLCDFSVGCVPTVWYFSVGCVPTVWYFSVGCVPTAWYFAVGFVPTVWYFSVGCVPTSVLVHYRYLGSNIFPAV